MKQKLTMEDVDRAMPLIGFGIGAAYTYFIFLAMLRKSGQIPEDSKGLPGLVDDYFAKVEETRQKVIDMPIYEVNPIEGVVDILSGGSSIRQEIGEDAKAWRKIWGL